MACHPPDHLPHEAVQREEKAELVQLALRWDEGSEDESAMIIIREVV